jgi:hypothetical protein
MKLHRLLQLCGILNLLLVGFHFSFWKLFHWQGMFGILSLFFSNELSATKLGRIVSLAIAGFWILRGLNQPIFWGMTPASSWVILFVCFAVAAVYIVASIHKNVPPNLTCHG